METATIEIPLEVKKEFEILAKDRGQDIQSFIIEIIKDKTGTKSTGKSQEVVNPLVLEVREAIKKRKKSQKKYDLVSMVGAGSHCSSFKSTEEIDTYIRNLRDEWDH